MATKDGSLKAVVSAIVGNGIIGIAKGVSWFFTGSPSMLAEAIHSIADTSNQILLYIGIRHGQKEATRDFPLGQGRARYIWNLMSAIGIFFIGFGVTAYHGIHSLTTNALPAQISWPTMAPFLFALIVEGYVFMVALKVVNNERGDLSILKYLRESDDPTTIGVLFEDGVAIIGILIAITGIWISQILGTNIPDAIASIIIACLMGLMAIGLAWINMRLLIGAAAPAANEYEIKKFIEEQTSVEKVIKIKTSVLGPNQLQLALEIEFHGGFLIDRAQLLKDAEKIRSGSSDPLPLLVDTAERTVRIMGNEINNLEKLLRSRFPALTVIELEVN